ncbi:MAG: hypothetical protein QOE90_822 [Thermoplasmata archaeon]|jgi:hypothetical protein|nr:hypothetical protein [Thermoplasmata archaeon]
MTLLVASALLIPVLSMSMPGAQAENIPNQTPIRSATGAIVTLNLTTTPAHIQFGDLSTANSTFIVGAPELAGLELIAPNGTAYVQQGQHWHTTLLNGFYYLFLNVTPKTTGTWLFRNATNHAVVDTFVNTGTNVAINPNGPSCVGQTWSPYYYSNDYSADWNAPLHDDYIYMTSQAQGAVMYCGGVNAEQRDNAWRYGYNFYGRSSLGGSTYQFSVGIADYGAGCDIVNRDFFGGPAQEICYSAKNPQAGIYQVNTDEWSGSNYVPGCNAAAYLGNGPQGCPDRWYSCCSQISKESKDSDGSAQDQRILDTISRLASYAGAAADAWYVQPLIDIIDCVLTCQSDYTTTYGTLGESANRAPEDYVYWSYVDEGSHSYGTLHELQFASAMTGYYEIHAGLKAEVDDFYIFQGFPDLVQEWEHWIETDVEVLITHG